MTENREPPVRASEIGQYTYCARAWWLTQRQGVQSHQQEALAAGTHLHQRHGRRLRLAGMLRRGAIVMAGIAIFLGLFALAILWLR